MQANVCKHKLIYIHIQSAFPLECIFYYPVPKSWRLCIPENHSRRFPRKQEKLKYQTRKVK